MIYCFDIDGTICSIVKDGDYLKAEPFIERIGQINTLYEKGHTILFNTARGFVTKIEWYQETEIQLKKWGVKYHQLFLSKPHADLYIDDKGIKDLDFFEKIN